MRSLSFILVLAALAVGGASVVLPFVRPAYPIQRELVDRNGERFDALIVGKLEGNLIAEPKLAPDPFEIPIRSLRFKDWLFAQWAPEYAPPPVVEVPVKRTITDIDGRSLKVEVLGRNDDSITIERISDSSRFDIPIDRLGERDRRFALRLRNEAAPTPSESPKPESEYAARRRALIEELKEKVDLYKKEIKSNTLSRNIHQKRVEDLAKMEAEIKALEVAIENHKYRTKER